MPTVFVDKRTSCKFWRHDEDHPDGPRDYCSLRPTFHGCSKPFIRRSDLYESCAENKWERCKETPPDDCPLWQGITFRAVRQGDKVRFL